jgi:hypothetical protein
MTPWGVASCNCSRSAEFGPYTGESNAIPQDAADRDP